MGSWQASSVLSAKARKRGVGRAYYYERGSMMVVACKRANKVAVGDVVRDPWADVVYEVSSIDIQGAYTVLHGSPLNEPHKTVQYLYAHAFMIDIQQ